MKKQLILVLSFLTSIICFAQNKVTIDFTTQKYIGDNSELSREKYFSMHSSYTDGDLAEDSDYLFNQLGIEFGRTFGGPKPFRKDKTVEPKISDVKAQAKNSVSRYKKAPLFKEFSTHDLIITDHPKEAFQLDKDYEKVAAYNAMFFKKAYPMMPNYYEIMNEPFVHSKDYVKSWDETEAVIVEMSKFHKVVADKIHAEIPNIKVGGYSAAWPEMELKDFWHWNTRMKVFMDMAGESMDFFATHLYDGRNVEGDFSYRSGSNSEAILQLIEAYSYIKWGVVKPHLISEYGYTAKGLQGKPYSPKLNGICLISYNNIMMGLMDKPDRVLKAVPFITGKGSWFYKDARNPEQHPYPWVISRKLANGNYKYTHLIKFYQLWKDVEGKRIDIASNNPDIQVNAFAKKGKVFIAINSLADEIQKINLDFLNKSKNFIKNTTLRRLYVNEEGVPKLLFFTNYTQLNNLELKVGETVIIECDVVDYEFSNTITENNYYSTTYLQKIVANQSLHFTIQHVIAGKKGRAALHMGIARDHILSKQPKVLINGKIVEVPTNWAGYDQKPRKQFFGVIAIPVDIKILKEGANDVEITFPDVGGRVSSVLLNVEKLNK
ncbi:beta-agarase [Polaribacter sp. Z014]|uniref:beta-agarase n=1 Tax=Polaribacter sp. Z014 TaxID=2927126 RepID=UPI002021E729|nr:beta-agarase [Polaribacter sp. Z014]MCL7762588.1 beta-agarase [Polaribacter sp. Z014]